MSYGSSISPTIEQHLQTMSALKGITTVMPYDTYRLYQVARAKSPAEVQRADEQAARLASAVSSLFRGITRRARAGRRLYPAAVRGLPRSA
jgi:hypothetical protein